MRPRARRSLWCLAAAAALLVASLFLLAQAGDLRRLDDSAGPVDLILSRRLSKKSASRPASEETQTVTVATIERRSDPKLIAVLRRHLDQYRRHPSSVPECNTTDITLGAFLTQKNG